MASINGDNPCTSNEVSAYLGKLPKETSMTRTVLIETGLIYPPERGKVAFTVLGMGEFIRRVNPTASQAYVSEG